MMKRSKMKQSNHWHPSLGGVASLVFATVAFTAPSPAAKIESQTNTHITSNATLPQPQRDVQFAQSLDSCYQVVAPSGLYVRREPTVYSEALGIVSYGRNVTVEGTGLASWAPISAPLQGYVYSGWVAPCQAVSARFQAASPTLDNCRLILADDGIAIRQAPSLNAEVVGYVASGRRVTIENRGEQGWVPISAPLNGYVSSGNLVYCR
jgi:uncharacterized protein YgiM (DUF1202 family)